MLALFCQIWYVGDDCSRYVPRRGKNGDKKKKRKAFTFHHCWKELANEEKWKNQELFEIPNKRKSSVGDATIGGGDDDASSGGERKRRPTPHSVAKLRRPVQRKNVKEKEPRLETMILRNHPKPS